jgi:hypothetical protein
MLVESACYNRTWKLSFCAKMVIRMKVGNGMTQTLSVVYDGEVFRPETPLDLKPNTRYLIIVQSVLPIPELEIEGDAWDVLDSLVDSYDGPEDWSAEHDHYLYGTATHKLD